jgi:hypothetical protein
MTTIEGLTAFIDILGEQRPLRSVYGPLGNNSGGRHCVPGCGAVSTSRNMHFSITAVKRPSRRVATLAREVAFWEITPRERAGPRDAWTVSRRRWKCPSRLAPGTRKLAMPVSYVSAYGLRTRGTPHPMRRTSMSRKSRVTALFSERPTYFGDILSRAFSIRM